MLDDADFRDWCSRLRLTQAAREAIAAIRSGRPTRCVGGGRRNVTGRFPSRKMGVTIQFESHRVELPFIYALPQRSTVSDFIPPQPELLIEFRRGFAASGWLSMQLFTKHGRLWASR